MKSKWKSPIYTMKARSGKTIGIDVTSSVSAGIPPHKVLLEEVIPNWKEKKLRSVLDFGCGTLRHTFPLLKGGFEVCSVEFEHAFQRPVSQKALQKARRKSNFSALIWPHEFIKDRRRFDAALLCFVLQIMPLDKERKDVIKYIYKKLKSDGYLLYMSRYGQIDEKKMAPFEVNDGYYMWPDREHHSFYREFSTEKTHQLFDDFGFKHIRSLSARGTEQVFIYGKGKGVWI